MTAGVGVVHPAVYPVVRRRCQLKAPPSRREREKGRAPAFLCVVKAWASPPSPHPPFRRERERTGHPTPAYWAVNKGWATRQALVVTDGKGEFEHTMIDAPRSARPGQHSLGINH